MNDVVYVRWFSPKELLPDKGREILAYNKEMGVFIAVYYPEYKIFHRDYYGKVEVTKWAALPIVI